MSKLGKRAQLITELSTGKILRCVAPDSKFHMASVIKLILMCYVLKGVDRKEFSLRERIHHTELYPMTSSYPGKQLARGHNDSTLGELVCAMASLNDSVIADYLLERIGTENLNMFCLDCGMYSTAVTDSILSINSLLLGETSATPCNWSDMEAMLHAEQRTPDRARMSLVRKTNITTPTDIAELLTRLCKGTLLSSEMTEFADCVLRDQVDISRMPRLLRSDERRCIRHSIGTVDIGGNFEIVHDVGYFRRRNRVIVMVYMNDAIDDIDEVEQSIALTTRDAIAWLAGAN